VNDKELQIATKKVIQKKNNILVKKVMDILQETKINNFNLLLESNWEIIKKIHKMAELNTGDGDGKKVVVRSKNPTQK
jgi:hypothetical protein